jgi:uncharacterized protein YndB with AHSA1/START domain
MTSTPATRNVRVSFVVPAPPDEVYSAWLDSARHGAMTGTRAEIEPRTFGRHMAADGYIEGVILELDAGRRIVQTWRSSEFTKSSPDSRLEVRFGADAGGTRVGIEHEDVPVDLADDIEAGWKTYYAEPMRTYFSQQGKRTAVRSPMGAGAAMTKAKKAGKAVKAKAAKAGKAVKKAAKAVRKAVKKVRGKVKAAAKKAKAKSKAKPKKAKRKAAPKKKAKAKKRR